MTKEKMQGKQKKVVSATKRPTKKKPKDKPKRPLSAYNFFFKEEREKILKFLLGEESGNENGEDSADYIDEEQAERLKKGDGKVSFEEMGKLIGQRWKAITQEKLARYTSLAATDTERYKKEMEIYNGKKEESLRDEPVWDGRPDQMYPPAPYMQGRAPMPPGGMHPPGSRYPNDPSAPTAAPGVGPGSASMYQHSSASGYSGNMYGYTPYQMDPGGSVHAQSYHSNSMGQPMPMGGYPHQYGSYPPMDSSSMNPGGMQVPQYGSMGPGANNPNAGSMYRSNPHTSGMGSTASSYHPGGMMPYNSNAPSGDYSQPPPDSRGGNQYHYQPQSQQDTGTASYPSYSHQSPKPDSQASSNW